MLLSEDQPVKSHSAVAGVHVYIGHGCKRGARDQDDMQKSTLFSKHIGYSLTHGLALQFCDLFLNTNLMCNEFLKKEKGFSLPETLVSLYLPLGGTNN